MQIQPQSPLFIAGIIAAVGILLVVIWLVTVVLRIIFDREPEFPAWQPPYRIDPMLNPETTWARRQMWQQHAQSDALPPPLESGPFAARKILTDGQGIKLRGWRVTGLRLTQFDAYGRVGRTQTIAPQRAVKRMNRVLAKAADMSEAALRRSLLPVARELVKPFMKKAKRTPRLPLALDVRLKAPRGEARIFFELYQWNGAAWDIMDAWEPDMLIATSSVQENFTYALGGLRSGEKPRQFAMRLRDDLVRILANALEMPVPSVFESTGPVPIPPAGAMSDGTIPVPTGAHAPVPMVIADDTSRIQAVTPPQTPKVPARDETSETMPASLPEAMPTEPLDTDDDIRDESTAMLAAPQPPAPPDETMPSDDPPPP
jgi:hypothetical protein